MTENDAGRRPSGPPPSSVTRGVEPVRPAVEAPSVEASGQIVYADSPPVSGNGIASVVFGALALVLALVMMSNEWGRLFVPTAALVGLSLLFAARLARSPARQEGHGGGDATARQPFRSC